MGAVHMRELSLLGLCRSLGAFRAVLDAMANKTLSPGLLLDTMVPLERFSEALERLKAPGA